MLLLLYWFFFCSCTARFVIYLPSCMYGKAVCVRQRGNATPQQQLQKKYPPTSWEQIRRISVANNTKRKICLSTWWIRLPRRLGFSSEKMVRNSFSQQHTHTLSHIRYRFFSHDIIYVCGKTCVEAAKIFLLEKRRQHHQHPSFLPSRPNRFLGSSNPSKKMFLGRFLNL